MADTSRIITSRQLDSNYAMGAYSETSCLDCQSVNVTVASD
jgi:hypothetical protein